MTFSMANIDLYQIFNVKPSKFLSHFNAIVYVIGSFYPLTLKHLYLLKQASDLAKKENGHLALLLEHNKTKTKDDSYLPQNLSRRITLFRQYIKNPNHNHVKLLKRSIFETSKGWEGIQPFLQRDPITKESQAKIFVFSDKELPDKTKLFCKEKKIKTMFCEMDCPDRQLTATELFLLFV